MREIDVSNKIVIPIAPLSIAMANNALTINYNTLAKSYFGTVLDEVILMIADATRVKVVNGKFTYASDAAADLRKPSCVVLIDSHQRFSVEIPTENEVDFVVRKRIDATHSKVIDDLTKTFVTSAYKGVHTVRNKYGEYYAIPKVVDALSAAQNDNVFNLLCKRLGVTIDKSLHIDSIQSTLKDNLKRFTSN